MRCVIYARVSTEHDSQKESIVNQVSFFKRYIEDKGWDMVDIYSDEGVSGTSIKKRVELQRLLKDARLKKFDCVLFKSVSRFARDLKDGIDMKRELSNLGIRLIFVQENIDTSDQQGEFLFGIHMLVAQQESEQTSQRSKFGLKERAKKGHFTGSIAPFGYRKNGSRLDIDPETSIIVKKIFQLYLVEGWGIYKICNYLTNQGIPTPRKIAKAKNAGELWHQNTVKIILTNEVYTGNLIQSKSEVIDIRTGNRKNVPRNQQSIVENNHPSIVTMNEFLAVQEQLKQKGRLRSNGKENLFAHIAVCAKCGSGMHYKKDRKSYICGRYGKFGKQHCSSHIVKADFLLTEVIKVLKDFTIGGVKTKKLLEIAKKESYQNQNDQKNELKTIEKHIQKLNLRQSTLLDMYNDGDFTKDEWRTQNEIIRNEQQSLNNRRYEIQVLLNKEKDTDSNFHAFEKQINNLLHLNIKDEKILKQILHKLITKIEVFEDGSIKITFNFKKPNGIKGA
ncbi:recombinase family protein [Niallia taxi]|uniref:recombinase family protein n=1 Tax=Niallia taxi TaxID=2499688 RepID=UPI002E222E05|nr:recombinase family protein [Niallia taxi]